MNGLPTYVSEKPGDPDQKDDFAFEIMVNDLLFFWQKLGHKSICLLRHIINPDMKTLISAYEKTLIYSFKLFYY